MRDISDWYFTGHGEKSTLQKEELLSPDNIEYIMKYPREFTNRVNWEDVNEVIAARIAQFLGIKTIEAEVAYRNNKRGCLMLHFLYQYSADLGETGAVLLESELGKEYNELQQSTLKGTNLVEKAFSLIENFSYFPKIKSDFVSMNIFDILIGNQDRHPHNWQILFRDDEYFFGPLYDNGASLGWQLPDSTLRIMLEKESEMNKYFKKTKVKSGLTIDPQPRLKATQVLSYLIINYAEEIQKVKTVLESFDHDEFSNYINNFPLISDIRKEFLKEFITFRKNKILSMIESEGSQHV